MGSGANNQGVAKVIFGFFKKNTDLAPNYSFLETEKTTI